MEYPGECSGICDKHWPCSLKRRGRQPLDGYKGVKSLSWWDHTKHTFNSLYLVLIHQLSRGHLEIPFNGRRMEMTSFQHIILCITPTNDAFRCHDQHVIDLMPLAEIHPSNRDCMPLIKCRQKERQLGREKEITMLIDEPE